MSLRRRREEEEDAEEAEERRALRHLKQGPNLKGVGNIHFLHSGVKSRKVCDSYWIYGGTKPLVLQVGWLVGLGLLGILATLGSLGSLGMLGILGILGWALGWPAGLATGLYLLMAYINLLES